MGQVDHCYLVGWVGVIFYYLSLSSLHSFSAIASRERKALVEEALVFLSFLILSFLSGWLAFYFLGLSLF